MADQKIRLKRPNEMGALSQKPSIGVVIPGYGHPQFLAEAITSACEQELDRDYKVVVVDDGCKFPETGRMVSQLMEKYSGTLHYFRQKNMRLPGARNAGVRFLLAQIPDIDSIYFLDADNRIAPYSLQAFRDVLGDDPQIGWAYPDISMFGLSGGEDGFDTRETAPEYSKLKHLAGNISEAGSLVRADVFRNGIFFDEEMTSGFEDWDFWLSAIEGGYVGRRVRNSGFLYRRRPESMLADSRRLEETLIARIREMHKPLFHPKNILKLEQAEAPSFAILIEDSEEVILTSDPKMIGNTVSITSFGKMARAWAQGPREHFFPTDMLLFTKEKWQAMQALPEFLRVLFWYVREFQDPFMAVCLTELEVFDLRSTSIEASEDVTCDFVVFKTSLINAALKKTGVNGQSAGNVSFLKPELTYISAPGFGSASAVKTSIDRQISLLEQFTRNLLPQRPMSSHQTRHYAGPACLQIRKTLIDEACAVEGRRAFPVTSSQWRTMIFVSAEYLFSQRAAALFTDILRRIRAAGGETLVVLEFEPGQSFSGADMAWRSLASDVVPLQLSGGDVEYRMYLGRRIPLKLGLLAKENVTVLARSCDVLLSCGAAAGLEALGQAKLHGAKGYVWLDPAFSSTDTQEMAHQAKLLAFEHAVANVITDQDEYVYGLSAEGFPPSKFETALAFWDRWTDKES